MDAAAAAKPKRQSSREGTGQLVAALPQDAIYVIQELLLKLGRQRGRKVTQQEAITEAMIDFAAKHGVELPVAKPSS